MQGTAPDTTPVTVEYGTVFSWVLPGFDPCAKYLPSEDGHLAHGFNPFNAWGGAGCRAASHAEQPPIYRLSNAIPGIKVVLLPTVR